MLVCRSCWVWRHSLTVTVNKREFAEVAEGLIKCSVMMDPDLSRLLLAREFFLRLVYTIDIPKRQLRKSQYQLIHTRLPIRNGSNSLQFRQLLISVDSQGKKIKKGPGRETAQSAKCLPCKHEDLSSNPSTHMQTPARRCSTTIPVLGRW